MDPLLQQGLAHHQAGRFAEAERCYRELLAHKPDDADALHLLGMIAYQVKQFAPAAQLIRRAIAINPSAAMYHNNLGICLRGMGEHEAADGCYQRAIDLQGDYLEAWGNLGAIRRDLGRWGDSAAAYEQALRIKPDFPALRASLATTRRDQGLVEEAIVLYRQALADDPTLTDAHANLCYTLHASDQTTPDEIYREHVEWSRRHAERFAPAAAAGEINSSRPYFSSSEINRDGSYSFSELDRDPERRLRVGYVSADLRDHAVAKFLAPLLEHRDRDRFEIVCYSGCARADAVTKAIRAQADAWHDTSPLADAALAELVHRDRIDILVDLAGHTNGTRMLAFARRPAPVQFTAIGYPGTTGLRTMDHRLTDAIADPPGETDSWHTEDLARVEGCFLAYPLPPGLPPLAPPPALAAGQVTFGSFNNLSKLSPTTLRLWRDVLLGVPGSRLIIKASALRDDPTREITRRRLAEAGIPKDRVELLGPVKGQNEHLKMYRLIDIALDTYPYNGTTTTCEALAMGVPVVSLHGRHHVSRVGLSLLTAAGFAGWATDDPGQYVEIARSLAADPAALATRRAGMRERLSRSVLCDGIRLARGVEAAYRNAWRRWCVGV